MSAKNCSLAVDYDEEVLLEEITSDELVLVKDNSHYHLRSNYPASKDTAHELVEIGGTITVSF